MVHSYREFPINLTFLGNVCDKIAENCLAYMPLLYKMRKIKSRAIASSALDSRSSGPGSKPGLGHRFVFMGNPAMNQHPIQGGVEICLVASCYKTGKSSDLMGHLARMKTLPFLQDWSTLLTL